jgi:hypothetical protein
MPNQANGLYEFRSFRLDTAKRLPHKAISCQTRRNKFKRSCRECPGGLPSAVLHDCLAWALPINP